MDNINNDCINLKMKLNINIFIDEYLIDEYLID